MEQLDIIDDTTPDTRIYEIIRMPECPIVLPKARTMTEATIDFNHIKPQVITWYNSLTPNK